MFISFIVVPITVGLLLPWIIASVVSERGRFSKGKYIARCPVALRAVSLIGLATFTVILTMCFLCEDVSVVNPLYIVMYIFVFLCLITSYVCFRYKIVLDLNKEEIIVYRIVGLKKKIGFDKIYSKEQKDKGEIILFKDKEGEKLLVLTVFTSGYAVLINCLQLMIKNNRNEQPIDINGIKELVLR